MQFVKLETRDQFMDLKKGDCVIVEWKPGSKEYKLGTPITANNIHGMHNGNELILNKKSNSYFNIDMLLRGESNASQAYLIQTGGTME